MPVIHAFKFQHTRRSRLRWNWPAKVVQATRFSVRNKAFGERHILAETAANVENDGLSFLLSQLSYKRHSQPEILTAWEFRWAKGATACAKYSHTSEVVVGGVSRRNTCNNGMKPSARARERDMPPLPCMCRGTHQPTAARVHINIIGLLYAPSHVLRECAHTYLRGHEVWCAGERKLPLLQA